MQRKTIPVVINSNLLREIDERRLINRYARHYYNGDDDGENEINIQQNLTKLLDWDLDGKDKGLPIYSGKFESIKRRDWPKLVKFIKDNREEIKAISYRYRKRRRVENQQAIDEWKNSIRERVLDENYEVSGKGIPAKPCEYKGKSYKSRREAMFKEKIAYKTLYKYLRETGQV